MQTIRPEFYDCANRHPLAAAIRSESNSDTDTDADSGGLMTMEMKDNQLKLLLERVSWMLKSGLKEDMAEAFEITRRAWQDADFGAGAEQILEDKLDEIIGLLAEDRALGAIFTKKAIGITPREAAAPAFVPDRRYPLKFAA